MSYDIIFAGGGATACITAGRLAEADPSLKILIIESGGHTENLHHHVQPARYFGNLAAALEVFSFHRAKPSDALLGRAPIVPTGRCVGGGSAVNFMVYTRAAASDYDDWEKVHGNEGWGSDHLIPLLKKAETYQAPIHNDTHGTSGPIKVSYAKDHVNLAEDFLEVVKKYDKKRGLGDDINSLHATDRYGRWQRYIDGETGKRSDTAHHYIYNQSQNKNLSVLTRHKVVRVIFEHNRAVGVEYVDDQVGRLGGVTVPKTARASRLVVLSAGAFGSPAILERSGVGNATMLKSLDIPVVVDLPGVGEHYMDHNLLFAPYYTTDDADTLDPIFFGTKELIEPYAEQWLKDGTGLMAHNGLDAGIKMRPDEDELKAMSPAFDNVWNTYFKNAPDKPIMLMGPFASYTGRDPTIFGTKCLSLAYYTAYPVSTGSVHITSKSDLYTPLDFHPGFLDDLADVVVLRWAYKKTREFARRSSFYRGEILSGHPAFPEGSKVAAVEKASPVPIDSPDLVYTKEDDEAIDIYHRQNVETTWHSVGTCAMKARGKGGVVDSRLNVYGVQGLKIADLSIIPGNVGANTYNTAIGVGEKAAVIIAQDLGISGVTEA